MATQLTDIKLSRVSIVDDAANPFAAILLAKRNVTLLADVVADVAEFRRRVADQADQLAKLNQRFTNTTPATAAVARKENVPVNKIEKCLTAVRDDRIDSLYQQDYYDAMQELAKREARTGEPVEKALLRVLATGEGRALYTGYRIAKKETVLQMPDPSPPIRRTPAEAQLYQLATDRVQKSGDARAFSKALLDVSRENPELYNRHRYEKAMLQAGRPLPPAA